MYFAWYHVEHHHQLTKQYQAQKTRQTNRSSFNMLINQDLIWITWKKIKSQLISEYLRVKKNVYWFAARWWAYFRPFKTEFYWSKEVYTFLAPLKLNDSYKPGKWTIKEILVHIIDDERIYALSCHVFCKEMEKLNCRALTRGVCKTFRSKWKDITNILEEYAAVRDATITLFNEVLQEEAFSLYGTANTQATVRAMCYHIAGHELHHVNFIKEFYL